MKTKIDIKSAVMGVLLGAAVVFSIGAATAPTNWEYKVVSGDIFPGTKTHLGDVINSNVGQGWDFVSASHGTERWAFAVLRREKR